MTPNLLILGGTREAGLLAQSVAEAGITATLSLAGRVDKPKPSPVMQRIGGFGGPEGLADYLQKNDITHVVDATHPFAAQMSAHAIDACERAQTPLLALSRAAWTAQSGDRWIHVGNMAEAAEALAGAAKQVFLAIGRVHLAAFANQPQHQYLLRLVDAPKKPLPLPKTEVILARGPFSAADDRALLEKHRIDLVVSKNAGGSGAYAKIKAARDLNLPVVMIDRPALAPRAEVSRVVQVMEWLGHGQTDRGV